MTFTVFIKRYLFELTKDIKIAIQKGDRKTILELYHHTFNVLMGNAVRYSNDQEKQMQIVNNSFLKIVSNIEQFKIGTAYFSWAKQIVHREIIDDFRKDKKYNTLFQLRETYYDSDFQAEIDTDYHQEFNEKELLEVLETLPPATKLVFNLFAIDEYSYKEIAEELSISYETVKWHIKDARKKLKQQISKYRTLKKTSGWK